MRILIFILLLFFISCNTKITLKGSKTQESFITFVYRNYPLTSDNEIQKLDKNKIFDKKLKKYVYDSLQNIDGFLMKIKEINLQQFENKKKISVVLVDYKDHLLDIDYYDSNTIGKKNVDSSSVLYRSFIDKKMNDYVFVYGKLDTILTFYKGFQWEDYKIDIDSVKAVKNINLIEGKREESFY